MEEKAITLKVTLKGGGSGGSGRYSEMVGPQ